MMRWKNLVLVLPTAIGALSGPLHAQEPTRAWTDAAELSFVTTTGNAEVSNLSLSNKFVYTWTSKADLTVDASALRSETTTRVLGNPDGTVSLSETTDKTAEAYALAGKYRHPIHERFLWYTAGGWMRNRFAGIDDRFNAGAGVGYTFIKNDLQSLVGEVGVDYTDESRVGGTSESFAGARAFAGYERALTPTSKLNAELEVLENLESTEDLRAKSVTAVTASVSKKLALKASFTALYDRQPVEVVVPGDGPGIPDAIFEFDETDTILSASLVINF